MPAKSKAQQKGAGAALAAKRRDQKAIEFKSTLKPTHKPMTERELDELALAGRKGKLQHVTKH
ncbi:MAG TPA: DUF3008 family protein [Pseudolabrys sp.]|jgi:hypothetical protein